jgi:hypothetical protein
MMEGLLIVRQNAEVHEGIKALLASIRLMRKEGAQAAGPDRPKAYKPKVERPRDESAAAANERRSATVFRLLHERPMSSDTGRSPQIEAALEETVNFKIEPQSLPSALVLLASKFHIPVVLDHWALRNAKFDVKPVQVKLKVSGLTLRDTLDLILANQPLGFEIRHGTLMVSTLEAISDDRETVVYDCRDLISLPSLDQFPSVQSHPAARNGGVFGGAGGGVFQAPPDPAKPALGAPADPQKPAEKAPPAAAPPAAALVSKFDSKIDDSRRLPLIRTIVSTVGDSWNEDSTSITEFDGLVIVRQSPIMHERIKRLLADIGRMRDNGAFASFAKEYEAEVSNRSASPLNRAVQSPTREHHPAAALPASAK